MAHMPLTADMFTYKNWHILEPNWHILEPKLAQNALTVVCSIRANVGWSRQSLYGTVSANSKIGMLKSNTITKFGHIPLTFEVIVTGKVMLR